MFDVLRVVGLGESSLGASVVLTKRYRLKI